MILTYTNNLGALEFYGDGGHTFNICAIEGLEPPSKQRRTQSYIGEDGCSESSSQYNQRVITMSCDTANGDSGILKGAARILSYGGTLTVFSSGAARKITVNEASLSIGKRYGAYTAFVIQFVCDYPHFSDVKETEVAIFKKINKLTSSSKLPLMLTERIADGNLHNIGEVRIYPTISVKKLSDKAGENTVTVTNLTTGKAISFSKTMVLGETLVIDVKKRTVISDIDGNSLNTLERIYSLSDMWCDLGNNNFKIDIGGSERGIEVYATYFNEYTEAL